MLHRLGLLGQWLCPLGWDLVNRPCNPWLCPWSCSSFILSHFPCWWWFYQYKILKNLVDLLYNSGGLSHQKKESSLGRSWIGISSLVSVESCDWAHETHTWPLSAVLQLHTGLSQDVASSNYHRLAPFYFTITLSVSPFFSHILLWTTRRKQAVPSMLSLQISGNAEVHCYHPTLGCYPVMFPDSWLPGWPFLNCPLIRPLLP